MNRRSGLIFVVLVLMGLLKLIVDDGIRRYEKNLLLKDDVQDLLDFAVAGFAKCGTTSLLALLSGHPEIIMHPKEEHSVLRQEPELLVKLIYETTNKSQGGKELYGFKCPDLFWRPDSVTKVLPKYWPTTKLVVGLRHPVLWFQSFYNFRADKLNLTMPEPHELIGACSPMEWSLGVCTQRGNFHHYLALLGKTNMTKGSHEMTLLNFPPQLTFPKALPSIPNPVFVYELSQVDESQMQGPSHALNFRKDLQHFLGLQQEFTTLPQRIPEKKAARRKPSLVICEPQYSHLRDILMTSAREASLWIRTYFMHSPDVTISSPQHFQEILLTWMDDPCET